MKKVLSIVFLLVYMFSASSLVASPSDMNSRLLEKAKTYELNIYLMAYDYFYWEPPVFDENLNVANPYISGYVSVEGEEVHFAQKPYGQYTEENKTLLKAEDLADAELISALDLDKVEVSYYYNAEDNYIIQKMYIGLLEVAYFVIWDKDGVAYMYYKQGV